MRKSCILGLIAVVGSLAVGASQGRCDYVVYGDFLHNFGTTQHPVYGSTSISVLSDEYPGLNIFFDKTLPSTHSGNMDVAVASYEGVASVFLPGTAVGHVTDAAYVLQVHLTDQASNQSGVLAFHGSITATVTSPGNLWDVTNIFAEPTLSLTLGANRYDVSIGPFAEQGGGNIMAHIAVSPVVNAPEPSGLLLAAAGASAFALSGCRRRRGPAAGG